MATALSSVVRGVLPVPACGTLTLRQFFEHVYRPLRLIEASQSTIIQHRVCINQICLYLQREATLDDLTEETIVGFMASFSERKLSPVTANSKRRQLLSLWRLARRKRYTLRDVEVPDRLREAKRLPDSWTEEEMGRLFEACQHVKGRIMGIPQSQWWLAMLLTFYNTGARHKALMGARVCELDFARKVLKIPAERTKTLCDQFYRLNDQCMQAILATFPPVRDKLFPWPFSSCGTLNRRFKMVLKAAGLPQTSRDLFHKLRRTCASHLAQRAGIRVAIHQLGHRDPNMIYHYIDPRFTAEHEAALHLPQPGWHDPAALQIDVTTPEPEPLPEQIIYVDPAALSADDLFSMLVEKSRLLPADVEYAIQRMGITKKDFAAEIGCSPEWISRILHGRDRIGYALDCRIREALGMRITLRPRTVAEGGAA